MLEQYINDYFNAVYDTDYDLAKSIIGSACKNGISPEDVVFKITLPAIEKMLHLYIEKNEATLSQHFLAAKISEEVVELMLPGFKQKPAVEGCIIVGTSSGDFHGLGRKIVAGCLRANMYTVHDLGLNVSPERFVDEAVKHDADIIGVSSMMVHTALGDEGPSGVRRILGERKLERRIKLIVGGAPYKFDENLYLKVGADKWGSSALEAVSMASDLIMEIRKS